MALQFVWKQRFMQILKKDGNVLHRILRNLVYILYISSYITNLDASAGSKSIYT